MGRPNCEVRLLDHTTQIQIDNCQNCRILVGPVMGSVFFRDCQDCTLLVACQQLRTRDCKNCGLFLLIPGHPIVETSARLRFGPLPKETYAEMEGQMAESGLKLFVG